MVMIAHILRVWQLGRERLSQPEKKKKIENKSNKNLIFFFHTHTHTNRYIYNMDETRTDRHMSVAALFLI
jgi:hypothetical protein